MTKKLWFLLLPFWLLATQANAEYFTITRFDIAVTFEADGSALFEETIDVTFSQPRRGIFRYIPIRSEVNGKTVDRIFKNVEVEGWKYTTSKENNNVFIRIGDPDIYVEGNQTYTIRYKVLNPLNFFDEHSEFYWDLLGISWPVNIETATFRLSFPPQVNLSAEQVRSYSGMAGQGGQDVEVQVSPRSVSGKSTRTFVAGEGMTVAVFFPEGTFTAMSSWSYFLERHGLLLAPIFFIFGGLLARYFARNKKQTIMTEYFPPEGISPAIAGGFVDHSVDNNDVLCLIPHLANQGYLRMEAKEGKGLFKKNEITFYKLKEAGDELFEFEKSFFNALFATGSVVELDDLKDKFHSHMTGVKASVKAWIMAQGWYEPDQKAMGCMTALGGVVALAWGAIAVFGRQNMDGFALIGTGLLMFYFASRFNKRSPAGNTTYRQLEGFRQFVKKAERPVIERLMKEDPLYYDKTMPFALAFGYLKQWNTQFQGLLTQPPSWYGSPGMHGAYLAQSWGNFSESFPSEINSIGSVFNSTPSSSGSGGGGGGGGFSGGGSGGGGGGSW